MKKVVLVIVLLVISLNAGWFQSSTVQNNEEPMLHATPFNKLQNKIGKTPIMIEFGSTSCLYCQKMGQILYKIKQQNPKSNIYFVNIYKDMPTAKKFGIKMIPTQVYLNKDGNIIGTHMGLIERDKLEKKLKNLEIIN